MRSSISALVRTPKTLTASKRSLSDWAISGRTREIGLRKATGAQNSDIILLFLIQAVVLTLIGGAIGVVIAAAGSALVSSLVDGLTVVVQFSNVLLAAGISAAIGIFFGVYPASRAARLNPIDALRYE